MAETAREYLMHRFRGDAQSLRERTAALRSGTSIPGPDANTSGRMADACEAVVQLLEGVPPYDDAQEELAALVALIPQLESRASASGQLPPVRAVFAGAATRIREVQQAEARAAGHGAVDAGDDDDSDYDADEADAS